MTRARLAAAVALSIAGCVTHVPATEVVVVIDAEPAVVRLAATLRVGVAGGARGSTLTSQAEQVLGSASSPIAWPVTVALAPAGGDVDRLFVVEADALDSTGATVGIVRARSSYVANRTLELRLTLEDCCRAVAPTCALDETCRSCMCTSFDVPVSTIPDYAARDAARADAGGDAGGARAFVPRNLPADVWSSATGLLLVHAGATIDTDSGVVVIDGVASRDFTSMTLAGTGGCAGIFVIATGEFRVFAGATVAVSGSRALAVVAANAIAIDGTVDVGAHGAVAGPGGQPRLGGGGYGSEGGLPGSCGSGGVVPTFGDQLLTSLCGGSTDDASPGGGGGGAIELATNGTFDMGAPGLIRAVGGGGGPDRAGGSGGAVLIQARSVRIAGTVSVNGGGGGGSATSGEDGHADPTAAAGGTASCPGTCTCGGSPCGAGGGAGAFQGAAAQTGLHGSNCAFCSGGSSCVAGGGGGGGAGRIRIEAEARDYPGPALGYPALPAVFTDGPLP